jgi:DNA-directed RNA polymerase alpha subunit
MSSVMALPTLARYRRALERIAAGEKPAREIAAEALLDRRLRLGEVARDLSPPAKAAVAQDITAPTTTLSPRTISAAANAVFFMKVGDLGLSTRSSYCMQANGIVYIGDLVRKTEADLLRTPKFSRKSLKEVKQVLAQMGLHLGMDVLDWPQEARIAELDFER